MSDERLLATFLDLVRIDSPTFHEAAIARFCAAELEAAGARVRLDATAEATGSDTGNLIARLDTTGPGAHVVLSAHMDTVEPGCGVEPVVGEDRVVRSAGATILGADDKVGVATILETVRRLAESDDPHGPVTVILSVAEEVGLVGAKALDPAELEGADFVLVLDAAGEIGSLVTSAPTHYTFRADFHGTASHAGVAPEDGCSALLMAARAVCAMELGRIDGATTANIGVIDGGVETNVVAAETVMTGECRSLDPSRIEEVRAAMEDAMRRAAADVGGSVDVAWTKAYVGYTVTPQDAVYRIVEAACADVGVAPRPTSTGGGADSNVFAAAGVPVLALGCGMKDVHSPQESVAVDDLELLTALLEAVVGRAGGGASGG